MRIRITEHGPYRVSGGVPLARTGPIETEYGEPIDWAADEEVPTGPSYALCRCGGSSTKPFCDDSHLTNGFDGTEVADRGRREDRMRVFGGDDLELTDDESLCTHAAFCQNRRTHVWEMIEQADDPEIRARLLEMVSHCPSGRLGARTSAEPEIEPRFPPSIAVVRDGALWVRGGVEVIGADGIPYERRNRMSLCRCGRSANMPFCDGTHTEIGFRDPAPATADVEASS
jgi:CDGSH-type Zn-finger protein